MKPILISILLLAFLAASATAAATEQGAEPAYDSTQAPKQGQAMRGDGRRMARMQEALGLSQEQMEQIREIRQNGGGRDEVRAVLTDEQVSIMEEHRKNRQAQGRGQGRGYGPNDGSGRRGPPPGAEEASDDNDG